MKNLIRFVFIFSAMTLLGSCSENSDSDNDSDIDANLLIGTWYLTGETENGQNTFDESACNFKLVFNDTQIISTEFFGVLCENSDDSTSTYEVTENIITETAEGESSTLKILELTPLKLVLEEVDGGVVYVETYANIALITSNIFGTWTLTTQSVTGCTDDADYVGPVTLNNDFTVTVEDDSDGSYMTNSWTFENNILTINTSYQDFFLPVCNEIDFQIATTSSQYTYDFTTDSFSGSSQYTESMVPGLDEFGNPCPEGKVCSSTETLTR